MWRSRTSLGALANVGNVQPSGSSDPAPYRHFRLAMLSEPLVALINCSDPLVLKRRHEESEKEVEQLLAKFDEAAREHIEIVKPVYLGFVDEFKNSQQYPMMRGTVSKEIERLFKYMKEADFARHQLRDYFEPSMSSFGYAPKMVANSSGALEKMYAIDCVDDLQYLYHPRNFVVVHRSMLRALRAAKPEDRMAFLDSKARGMLRRVADFTLGIFDPNGNGIPAVFSAERYFRTNKLPTW